MLLRGEVSDNNNNNNAYDIIIQHTKRGGIELLLVCGDKIISAYKEDESGQYAYGNSEAKNIYIKWIRTGIRGCTAKNAIAAPFVKGTVSRHRFIRQKVNEYTVDKFKGELAGICIMGEEINIQAEYDDDTIRIPDEIPYIKLTAAKEFNEYTKIEDYIQTKKLEEIGLDKDITWLENKKYYIVNDDETAEKIFSFLDKYRGPITYDTETTGLKINMFSKVNSKEQKILQEYNSQAKDKIRVDRLVGIIFCVEPDVSYYFPVGNRKFKNLYEDVGSEVRKDTIRKIKEAKRIEDKDCSTDMGRLLRDTQDELLTSDVILMERVRGILENGHIVAHNASFEWRVSYCYDIDVNIKDDTMILHQIIHKFRSTTSNRGEPSRLDYLAKVELGIDQLSLKDFFAEYSEDSGGKVKKNKKNIPIDFSFMDYEGCKAYAPADGDVTLQVYFKYKRDLIEKYKELEYIYNVEVVDSMAVGYMEFFGHRLNEGKIQAALDSSLAEMSKIEKEIRQLAGLKEDEVLNLASPIQVAKLFYDKMEIPFKGDKYTVGDKVTKQYTKMKDEDGNYKYPVVHLYRRWKSLSTLVSKFFGNLPSFTYPGGYVFSSYGQISTATGRMSSKEPNAQQYPDPIKSIVSPRPNHLMFDIDFSQIEYRTLVALAREIYWVELFKDPDIDYHTLKASAMYDVPYASVSPNMRDDAKSFNFGIPYGMGFKSLAILLTGMSGSSQVEEAKKKYELYFKDQPNVRKFFEQVKEMALVNKYTKTHFNRYRYYSFVDSKGETSNWAKASALRQAGNAVIQGTAADIFKIAVARTFFYIRENKLFGKLLLVNMIHDELLMEIDCSKINAQRVLKDITECMSLKIGGFPPLYVGAGFGMNWGEAKGAMNEIHPNLNDALSDEIKNCSLYDTGGLKTPEDVVEYFNRRILDFRLNKVKDYLVNPDNLDKDLHPVIGKIINLQFTYGLEEQYSKEELTTRALKEFIDRNQLDVDYSRFGSSLEVYDDVDDTEYGDGDEDIEDDEFSAMEFALIDEDEELYGVSLQELIQLFGLIISKERKICGINTRIMSYNKKDEMAEYFTSHLADKEDTDSLQVVFLKDNNVLFETGVYVSNIESSEVASKLRLNTLMYA